MQTEKVNIDENLSFMKIFLTIDQSIYCILSLILEQ